MSDLIDFKLRFLHGTRIRLVDFVYNLSAVYASPALEFSIFFCALAGLFILIDFFHATSGCHFFHRNVQVCILFYPWDQIASHISVLSLFFIIAIIITEVIKERVWNISH